MTNGCVTDQLTLLCCCCGCPLGTGYIHHRGRVMEPGRLGQATEPDRNGPHCPQARNRNRRYSSGDHSLLLLTQGGGQGGGRGDQPHSLRPPYQYRWTVGDHYCEKVIGFVHTSKLWGSDVPRL